MACVPASSRATITTFVADLGVINYNTPGFQDNVPTAYLDLGVAPVGGLVLDMWLVVVVEWDNTASGDYFSLGVGNAAGASGPTVKSYTGISQSVLSEISAVGGVVSGATATLNTIRLAALVPTSGHYWANYYKDDPTPTTVGQFHAYASVYSA